MSSARTSSGTAAIAIAGAAVWLAVSAGRVSAQQAPARSSRDRVERVADQSPQEVTLDPRQFVGPVRQAYQVAKKDPALLAQLHCYCGCDRSEGHRNLLDCYRSRHAATCEICTQEALQAEQMSKEGSPVAQIRDALHRRFAGEN